MVEARVMVSLPGNPNTRIRPVGANDPSDTPLMVTVVFVPDSARAMVSLAMVPPTYKSVLEGSSSLGCRFAATIETLRVCVVVAPSSSVTAMLRV